MKNLKGILSVTVATVLLIITGCSSGPEKLAVEASYDDFMKVQDTISRHVSKEIEVPAGSSFTVTLWSNQTTGFKWSEEAQINDQTVLRQTGHEYLASETTGDKPPAPGTPGNEVWTFNTLKKGTTDISMEYSQPWEGGEKDAFGFFLTVVVK